MCPSYQLRWYADGVSNINYYYIFDYHIISFVGVLNGRATLFFALNYFELLR